MSTLQGNEPRWVNLYELYNTGAYELDDEDREKVVYELSHSLSTVKPGELGSQQSMSWAEELIAIVFLFVFVGCMLWLPISIVIFSVYCRSITAWIILMIVWLIAAYHPVPRSQNFVHSKLNKILFKYFSLKMAWESPLTSQGTYIFAAFPHAVFPYGNLLTVHAMRNINGIDFRGLTTDQALKLPLFRHYLGLLGVIPASNHIAKKYLDQGWSLGISTGGVAEIFSSMEEDECIVLRERKGFVKLALKTGTEIVPCYLFGNTKILSAWYDRGGLMESISRRLKFGLLPLWGRFGLPILKRHPILGVIGKPIKVPKVEGEPSQEMIDKYHQIFVDKLQELFEKYKKMYGWEHKKLIIK